MANKTFRYYSEEHYTRLLRERDKKIATALNQTRSLPRELQERILDEAGVFDMPPRGYYVPDYTQDHVGPTGWRGGSSGFY